MHRHIPSFSFLANPLTQLDLRDLLYHPGLRESYQVLLLEAEALLSDAISARRGVNPSPVLVVSHTEEQTTRLGLGLVLRDMALFCLQNSKLGPELSVVLSDDTLRHRLPLFVSHPLPGMVFLHVDLHMVSAVRSIIQ